jgi:leader peptidase (prepilin peptidase) / N-methyltransferase
MRVGVTGLVVVWLVVMSCYDLRQRRLPNWLTLPGSGAILIGAATTGRAFPVLAGAAALTGAYLLVHLASPTGMGAGDVKLAIGLGGLAGWFGVDVWLAAAVSAPLLTALCGMWCGVRAVPHGPSMCVATAAACALLGDPNLTPS